MIESVNTEGKIPDANPTVRGRPESGSHVLASCSFPVSQTSCISILSNDGLVSLGIIDSHSQARSRHAAARIATGSFTCHVPERPGIPMAGDNQTASPSRRNPVKDNVPSGEIFLCPRPAYRRRPARLPGAGGTWLSELPAKKTIPRDVRASRKESGPSHV